MSAPLILARLEMTVGKSLMSKYMMNITLSCTNTSSNPLPSFFYFSTAKEKMPVLAMRGKLEMTVGKFTSDYFDHLNSCNVTPSPNLCVLILNYLL